jgi:hypothetical protein
MEGGYYHPLMKRRIHHTCAGCQLVCHPDREERQNRHSTLTQSGVVIQNSNGSLKAVSPKEAQRRIAAMDPEKRALYEED